MHSKNSILARMASFSVFLIIFWED